MDKNYTQLAQRLDALQKKVDSLDQSSTISYQVQNAFSGRGFLNSTNFYISGRVTLGVGGSSLIPIPGANAKSVAFATYSTFPDTGSVDAYIEAITGGYQLHLDGIGTKVVNWVVFLNNIGTFKAL